jgi:malonate transporter and related proteins
MTAILDAVLPIFALILAGYLCGKGGLLGVGATPILNRFVVWLALPATLFLSLATSRWAQIANGHFILAFGGGMLCIFLVSLWRDLHRGMPLADAALVALSAGYPNTGFMGIPLSLLVLGPRAVPPAIVAAVLTVCALFALAIVLVEAGLQRRRSLLATIGGVSLTLIRNPIVASAILGLAYQRTGWSLSPGVHTFLAMLGDASAPCALVTIGLFLSESKGGGGVPLLARTLMLKLVAQPALTAVLAFWVFPMPAPLPEAAVLLAALPTGTGPFILAELYEREAAVASRVILLSTLLAVVTVTWLGLRLSAH